MRRLIVSSVLLFVVAAAMLHAQKTNFVPASDSRLAYVGRMSLNGQCASWTYPGLQIHAAFTGTSLRMKTSPGCGFFMVEIDDREPFKIEASETDSVLLVADGLGAGEHRVALTYAIEGLLKHPKFYGFLLDDEATLCQRPQLPERKMEFIGNSITCAYGIEGDGSEKKFSYSQQNVYYAYESLVARALNAQCQIVARSGIGIYRNNNGNVRGDKNVLPALYPYTQFGMGGERWDFSRYQPDVVCVNLGTNDTTHPSYETSLLTAAFKQFLVTLRGHYPHAKIVLLTGTMLKGQRLEDVKRAQQAAIDDAVRRGDDEVYRFDFTPADGTYGYGTHKHPSKRQHAHMAEELIPFIRKITGWK